MLLSLLGVLRSAVRAPSDLIIENPALRQQLAVFKRHGPCRRLAHADRLFWIALSRFWSRWREVLVVVKPATVVGWHRWAFRRFWTWRSRHRQPGRPPTSREVRALIKHMAAANVGWGAPRIHGELLNLGIVISEREVSRLMPPRRRKPPSQTWRTFLDNHVGSLVSIDFFTVPTATFRVLYVFFVLAHDRRRILHFNVTEHPGAQWTAQQRRLLLAHDPGHRHVTGCGWDFGDGQVASVATLPAQTHFPKLFVLADSGEDFRDGFADTTGKRAV
jgi:putative transposase